MQARQRTRSGRTASRGRS